MSEFWQTILSFVPAFEPYLRDQAVSEILVDPPDCTIYIERAGRLEDTGAFLTAENLHQAVLRLARAGGKDFGEDSPRLGVRARGLNNETIRINATHGSISVGGIALSIRKSSYTKLTLNDLLAKETLTSEQMEILHWAMAERMTLVISGGTGAGKTSLLNALSVLIPADERILVIEDVAELEFQRKRVVQLQAREEPPQVNIRDLLKDTLRFRPDRIILGECRGAEAVDFLNLTNTGHKGTMLSIHSDGCEDALYRLFMCALLAPERLPERFIKECIGRNVHVVAHMARDPKSGTRRVMGITRVVGYDPKQDAFGCEYLSGSR